MQQLQQRKEISKMIYKIRLSFDCMPYPSPSWVGEEERPQELQWLHLSRGWEARLQEHRQTSGCILQLDKSKHDYVLDLSHKNIGKQGLLVMARMRME